MLPAMQFKSVFGASQSIHLTVRCKLFALNRISVQSTHFDQNLMWVIQNLVQTNPINSKFGLTCLNDWLNHLFEGSMKEIHACKIFQRLKSIFISSFINVMGNARHSIQIKLCSKAFNSNQNLL